MEMSGSGQQLPSDPPDDSQSDSSFPISTEALVGICVGGGVLLISCLLFTCVCVICCICRRRGRKQTLTFNHDQGSEEDATRFNNSAHPSSTRSSAISTRTHSITTRLLSFTSRGRKAQPLPISRDSDLTIKITPTDNSNPLYNSSSVAYITSKHQQQQQQVAETPLSAPNSAVLSTSPRRHSLGYVEMQSAGPALQGIAASLSVGDFSESIQYDSIRDQGYNVAFAPTSVSPGHDAPFLTSLSGVRQQFLQPTIPPPHPSSSSSSSHPHSSHPHTSTTANNKKHTAGRQQKLGELKDKEKDKKEEEDRGGEDDYVDPKLFREDQEKIQQEEVFDMAGGSPGRNDFMVTQNTSYSSPPTGKDFLLNDAPSPSYQNIQSSSLDDEAYLSDSYEQVNEFLSDDTDSHDRATLLLAVASDTGDRGKSRTAPSTPLKKSGVASGDNRSPSGQVMKGAHSVDNGRKLSIDNQYVEVVSPARKSKSMKVQSKGNQHRGNNGEVALSPTEQEYQNVVPGTEAWGRGNVSRSLENLQNTSVDGGQRSGGQSLSPRERGRQEKRPKTPSPTPRTKSSPKPLLKPKPHPSTAKPHPLSAKPRSQSADPVKEIKIVEGQSTSHNVQRKKLPHHTHHEAIVIPVANGNIVAHSNRDDREGSATVPVDISNERRREGEERDEGGEVLYVNVGEMVEEEEEEGGGNEVYENVNHFT